MVKGQGSHTCSWHSAARMSRTDLRLHAQGMSREEAIAAFCRIYAEAHTPERATMNFFERA